jgi:hypothetical protein
MGRQEYFRQGVRGTIKIAACEQILQRLEGFQWLIGYLSRKHQRQEPGK